VMNEYAYDAAQSGMDRLHRLRNGDVEGSRG
jgi:hypothetical protein